MRAFTPDSRDLPQPPQHIEIDRLYEDAKTRAVEKAGEAIAGRQNRAIATPSGWAESSIHSR